MPPTAEARVPGPWWADPQVALALAAGVSALLYITLCLAPEWLGLYASMELRLLVYPALFAVYFLACYLLWRERARLTETAMVWLVAGAAILFRIIVLVGPVADNNDNWRYLWEGRVLLEGMNPYAAPPGSPKYADLRRRLTEAGDPLYQHILPMLNNVRSVYGPVATGLFAIPSLLPLDRVWCLRLMMSLFDVGTMLVLMGLLRSLGRSPVLALVYGWSPVCLNAFADRAQIDGAMVFLLALAAWSVCVRRPGWAGLALGLSMLVKISPLLLILPFVRFGRGRVAMAWAPVMALGALAFLQAGPGAFSGFREFSSRWQNIDSLHGLVLLALQPLKGRVDAAQEARLIVTVAAGGYALWRTFQGLAREPQWLLEACAAIAGVGLLLSPVVYPWYTIHMLIFLCFAPNPGLLLLPLAAMSWFLCFWQPAPGTLAASALAAFKAYREPWRWIAYPPVYALLLSHWLRRRAGDRGPRTEDRGPTAHDSWRPMP